jgi:hypothetical protein
MGQGEVHERLHVREVFRGQDDSARVVAEDFLNEAIKFGDRSNLQLLNF